MQVYHAAGSNEKVLVRSLNKKYSQMCTIFNEATLGTQYVNNDGCYTRSLGPQMRESLVRLVSWNSHLQIPLVTSMHRITSEELQYPEGGDS